MGIYSKKSFHLKNYNSLGIEEFYSKTMKNQLPGEMIRFPNCTAELLFDRSMPRLLPDCHSNESFNIGQNKEISRIGRKINLGFNVENFTKGILEHVSLAPKITETVKGKLRLGARILQLGGVEKVFKKHFRVGDGERLLKASQCYLSTTDGPIAGLLFISTEKVAFCSERSIKLFSPTGKLHKIYYKVSIPLRNIRRANASENTRKPSQKYIEVVTVDNFEFWFMGFLNHPKTLKYLQQVLQETQ